MCSCGGIGIHVRFKIEFRQECKFDSCHEHQCVDGGMADTLDLKSDVERRVGSNPTPRTILSRREG